MINPKYFLQISKHYTAVLRNLLSNYHYQLTYIVEPANWIIKSIGETITGNLNCKQLLKARTAVNRRGIRNQIIHFGSIHTMSFLPHHSNRVVLSWFHVIPNLPRNELIKQNVKAIDIIHTASNITKNNLIKMGFPSKLIKVIPLGVDLSLFKPLNFRQKKNMRKKLKLPSNKFIIGSFQKDGNGWGKGLQPKLEKGPDILVEVVEKLAKYCPIHVLLTGPARGYVKKRLEKANIPYTYKYLDNYLDIVNYYQTLDLYLITSRIEGGPKAILESWATGIPVVSTKVGMVADIAVNNQDVLLAGIANVGQIVKKAKIIIEKKELRKKIVNNGFKKVRNYDWPLIAEKYYQLIYKHLL